MTTTAAPDAALAAARLFKKRPLLDALALPESESPENEVASTPVGFAPLRRQSLLLQLHKQLQLATGPASLADGPNDSGDGSGSCFGGGGSDGRLLLPGLGSPVAYETDSEEETEEDEDEQDEEQDDEDRRLPFKKRRCHSTLHDSEEEEGAGEEEEEEAEAEEPQQPTKKPKAALADHHHHHHHHAEQQEYHAPARCVQSQTLTGRSGQE